MKQNDNFNLNDFQFLLFRLLFWLIVIILLLTAYAEEAKIRKEENTKQGTTKCLIEPCDSLHNIC